MLRSRLIPCLLLDKDRLVKTARYKNPKYVGDPVNAIRIFNDKEVDELILIDITATKNKREPDFGLLERISSECFMPLCYGGGITTIEQAQRLFAIGIEKICIQTEYIKRPGFVKDLSAIFGSQSIVVSVDVKKNLFGRYQVYSAVENKAISIPIADYIKGIEENGAGEILISVIDLEGAMSGLDLNMIRKVTESTSLPIIANAGVGSVEHIIEGFKAGADAVAAGSFFVFHGPHKAVLITYPKLNEFKI